jgi:hypothetical protein
MRVVINSYEQLAPVLHLHMDGLLIDYIMQINNQSIQDMQMFGDPLRIPIVIVERVMNAPRRTISENSYLRNVILPNSHNFQAGLNSISGTANKESNPQSNAHVLKIVVFVHGFQASSHAEFCIYSIMLFVYVSILLNLSIYLTEIDC